MLSKLSKEFLRPIVEIFTKTTGCAILLYEVVDTPTKHLEETIRSSDSSFSIFCQGVWNTNDGKGRQICSDNMCARASEVYSKGTFSSSSHTCHLGMDNYAFPIKDTKGKLIGILLCGAWKVADQTSMEERLFLFTNSIKQYLLSESEQVYLREALEDMPSTPKAHWDWVRKTIPSLITNIITQYIKVVETERQAVKNAKHHAFNQFQSALAVAENLSNNPLISENPELQKGFEFLMGTIEASARSLHTLTQSEFIHSIQSAEFAAKSIKRVILSAFEKNEALARQKDIELRLLQIANCDVEMVEESLLMAFDYLAHNAVKYSYRTAFQSSQRHIDVVGRKLDSDYEITITNYGVGIEEDEYDKIFHEGYRGKLTLLEDRLGTGHGLSFVKKAIEQHHGHISVISKPVGLPNPNKEGPHPYKTTFSILIPLQQTNLDMQI